MPITYQISEKFTKSSKVFSTKHACEGTMRGVYISYCRVNPAVSVSAHMNSSRTVVYLHHLEKHRKKVSVGAKIDGKPNRKVVSKAFWKLTEYVVPIENIIEARQYARHFKLVLKA